MSALDARALIGFFVAPRLFWTWTFFLMTSSDCLCTESKSSWDTLTVSKLLLLSCSKVLKKFLNVTSSGFGTDTVFGVVFMLLSGKKKPFKFDQRIKWAYFLFMMKDKLKICFTTDIQKLLSIVIATQKLFMFECFTSTRSIRMMDYLYFCFFILVW